MDLHFGRDFFGVEIKLFHHLPNYPMRTNDKFWLGVPLMVGNIESGLQPDPLLAFRQESVVAGGTLTLLHQCFVATRHIRQVVDVVIVVAGST